MLESVPADPVGGVLYEPGDDERLALAVEEFERLESRILPRELRAWAGQFSEERFAREMRAIIEPAPAGESAIPSRRGF